MPIINPTILTILTDALSVASIVGVSLFPVWLGRRNELGNFDMMLVMSGAILLGWTIIGWFYALWHSSKIKIKLKSEK